MNMIPTPDKANMVPKTSRSVTVSFLIKYAYGINIIGVIDISVDATPGLIL